MTIKKNNPEFREEKVVHHLFQFVDETKSVAAFKTLTSWRGPRHSPIRQIFSIFGKKLQKMSCKRFLVKANFLNFVNLSPAFYPRLFKEKDFYF